jgi:Rad3-related DNA helicase
LAAIAKLDKKDAESMVMEALNDGEEKIRNQAASLIEHELSLSGESINKLLLFLKEKLHNKNLTAHEAGFIAGLLRAVGKFKDGLNKESLESEIIGIASDLLHERKGLLKFIKKELSKEQEEIISACVSVLGKTGGTKSKEFLKTFLNNNSALSNAAIEA